MTIFVARLVDVRERLVNLIADFAMRPSIRKLRRQLLFNRGSSKHEIDTVESDSSDPTATDSAARPHRPGRGSPERPVLGWTELGIATVSFLAFSIMAGAVAEAIWGIDPPTVLVLLLTAIVTSGAAATAVSARARSIAAVGLRPVSRRWLWIGAGSGALVWLVNALLLVGYMALTGDWSLPQEWLTNAAAGSTPELLGVLLAGALLAPFGEELLFRGVGYGALRRYGVFVAAAASSVVFGLAHGISVVLPAAILLGVVAALLYERSGSIWPAVTAHAVNNAIVFMVAAIFL